MCDQQMVGMWEYKQWPNQACDRFARHPEMLSLWPGASAILIVEPCINDILKRSSSKNIAVLGTFVSFACKVVDLVLIGQDGEVLCRMEVAYLMCVFVCLHAKGDFKRRLPRTPSTGTMSSADDLDEREPPSPSDNGW